MANSEKPVLFEAADGIARITLNRPQQGNALNDAMRSLVAQAWAEVEGNDAVRVAIVSGAGDRHFCTGADVGRLERERAGDIVENQRKAGPGGWSSRHYGVTKPVICAVNGIVNGAGLHFAVDADIVVGTRNATFMDTHVNVGQVGALENIGLAKRMPLGAALRITLMGRKYRLGAERAHQLGMLDELYDTREEMLAAAAEMAGVIRDNSPSAVRRSKEAIWQSLELAYREALDNGWQLICDQRGHADAQEGVKAFVERRAPRWQP